MGRTGIKFLTDFGPLLVFFVMYFRNDQNLKIAIPPFVIATVISLAVVYFLEKKMPMVPLVSGILITLFGGLTLYFDNKIFFCMKPTIINILFAAILFFGRYFTKKPLLKIFFQNSIKIEEEGWGPFGWGKKEQTETPKVKVTNLDSGGVLIQSGKTPTATQEGYDALVDKLGPDHKRTQFYKRRLEAQDIQKNENANKISSISRKAEYEELAPVVVEVPVIVKTEGNSPPVSTTVVSGGSGGESGNDPYEVLDFQG